MTKGTLLLSFQKTCMSMLCVFMLLTVACSTPQKGNRQGPGKQKPGDPRLKITDKKFAMDSDLEYAEDYFVKGDTIFTSFQGNQPYTKFVVQILDDHDLKLLS